MVYTSRPLYAKITTDALINVVKCMYNELLKDIQNNPTKILAIESKFSEAKLTKEQEDSLFAEALKILFSREDRLSYRDIYLAGIKRFPQYTRDFPLELFNEDFIFTVLEQSQDLETTIKNFPTEIPRQNFSYRIFEKILAVDGLSLSGVLQEVDKEENNKIYTPEQKKNLCLIAIMQNPMALKFLPSEVTIDDATYLNALKSNWKVLKFLPEKLLDKSNADIQKAIEKFKSALTADFSNIEYLPEKLIDAEMLLFLQNQLSDNIGKIHGTLDFSKISSKILTENFLIKIVKQNAAYLRSIPKALLTYEVCRIAIESNPYLIDIIKSSENRNLSNEEFETLLRKAIFKDDSLLGLIGWGNLTDDLLFLELLKNRIKLEIIHQKQRNFRNCLAAIIADLTQLQHEYFIRSNIIYFSLSYDFSSLVEFIQTHKISMERLIGILKETSDNNSKLTFVYEFILKNQNQLEELTNLIKLFDFSRHDGSNFEEWPELLNKINSYPANQRNIAFDFIAEKMQLSKLIETTLTDFELRTFEYAEKIANIANMVSEKNPQILYIFMLIQAFRGDFRKLGLDHGLLTCAQTANRKQYPFDPIILNGIDLSDYLKKINETIGDFRQRIALSAAHWQTLDIERKNGKLRVLVIDSLGDGDGDHSKPLIEQVAKNLNSNGNPPQIYFDCTKRQHGALSCSVFSLDDLIHLFTVENFLNGSSLFEYFDKQGGKEKVISDTVSVREVKLPLSLMRTLQSRSLVRDIIPGYGEEADLVVNKKGETAGQSVSSFFSQKESGEWEGQNKRLENKFTTMGKHNLLYLLDNSVEEVVEQQMRRLTFKSFLEKQIQESVATKGEPDSGKWLNNLSIFEEARRFPPPSSDKARAAKAADVGQDFHRLSMRLASSVDDANNAHINDEGLCRNFSTDL